MFLYSSAKLAVKACRGPLTPPYSRVLSTVATPAQVKAAFGKTLEEENRLAELGGGEKRIENQHKKGKLTARKDWSYYWMRARSANMTS